MKIFSVSEIKKWEDFTLHAQSISSLQLMERAAEKCAEWLLKNYKSNTSFLVFCGVGNNGGDGFALARLLYLKDLKVAVFLDLGNKKFSPEAEVNYKNVQNIPGIAIKDFSEVTDSIFKENSVIIDALFGIGLNRKIAGETAEVIQFLNDQNAVKISIDVPSGLFPDVILADNSIVFKADHTLSFQSWKKSFLHPETGSFCGQVHVLDLALDQTFEKKEPSSEFIIDEHLIAKIYRKRDEFSHKGNLGKTQIVAGSFGKIGAAVLATKAALRTGSGITFIQAPKCGYEILQSTAPEAMFLSGGENCITNFSDDDESTFGVGPGLGTELETENALLHFLKNHKTPLVLDADALNILGKDQENLKLIPVNSVITPHPKEFARLFGTSANSFERVELAKAHAKKFKIIIVLKDHHTQVITPSGDVYYNITGNSGMAKGGSGDALLGIITSLLSQNYSPRDAAIFGVWLHGKAGDFAAEEFSKEAMLPSDLIDQIGNVFKFLIQKNPSK